MSVHEVLQFWNSTKQGIVKSSNSTFSPDDPKLDMVASFLILSEGGQLIEDHIKDLIQDYSNGLRSQAILTLIGSIVGTLVLICLSLCIACVFSKTILSPWKRVLILQEDTVHKFVPREFMTIIQKDRMLDLEYGDYFEKELDIMFVDIRNYTGISENMQARELFNFLNSYLSLVGPLITNHGGYIDKYMGK